MAASFPAPEGADRMTRRPRPSTLSASFRAARTVRPCHSARPATRRRAPGPGVAGTAQPGPRVLLANPPAWELRRERELRDVVLGDDHHAAGVLVEPMDDPGTRRVTARVRGDLADDGVHERAGRVSVRRMHDGPRGLVHDEDVVILVEDRDGDVLATHRPRR